MIAAMNGFSDGRQPGPNASVVTSRSFLTISRNTPLAGYSAPLPGSRIVTRNAPPGRGSNSWTVVINGAGANHCARSFGFVHPSNSRSRGASTTRASTSSRSDV
jgi:hypothetical protein